ncbi:MAG: hypothetical protein V9F46_10920 [Chitinophagaceae bacterium]
MKLFVARLILAFLIFSLFQKTLIGQCTISCPSVFTMRDTINCNIGVDIMRNNPGPGYSNSFSLVRSCQNTLMKYFIDVNQTCYAGTTYNFLSISGGTFISLSGNSFTILWGAANSGQVQIAFTTPGSPGLAPCSDIITINFSLVPKPVAAFTAAPHAGFVICFQRVSILIHLQQQMAITFFGISVIPILRISKIHHIHIQALVLIRLRCMQLIMLS